MLTVDFSRLGLHPGDRLLDLGCGGGRHAFAALRAGARVVALDLTMSDLRGAAEILAAMVEEERPIGSAHAVNGDAARLPFPDGTFDRIVAAEILEHIPDDEGVMRELYRVLRPDGTIAVTVPRFFPELLCWALSTEYHSNEGGHVRIYREGELVSRLRSAGFVKEGTGYAHALHSPYWWLKCAIGVRNEKALPVRLYHGLLVWDITKRPLVTRALESALNPVLGKSLVVYLRKPSRVREPVHVRDSGAQSAKEASV